MTSISREVRRQALFASLPFVQQAVEEMTRVMPADQVICGIPFYTRVWTEKFGQSAITSEVLGMDGAKKSMPKRIR